MPPSVVFGNDETATEIAAGEHHSCAMTSTLSTGGVRCWGENTGGQLGIDNTNNVGCGGDCPTYPNVGDSSVVFFSPTERAVQLAAGAFHTCALLSSSAARCWGFNNAGQLGQGDTLGISDTNRILSDTPSIDFGSALSVVQISAGAYHTCAILSPGGGVRCWGDGSFGRLGNGGNDNVGAGEPSVYPTVAEAPNGNFGSGVTATKVAAGGSHTCALLSTGAVRCSGTGMFGELGIGAAPAFVAVGTGADVDLGLK